MLIKTYTKMERKFFERKGEWSEAYLQPNQTCKMKKAFCENSWKSLTALVKSLILGVWKGSEYTYGHYTDSLIQTESSWILFSYSRPNYDFCNSSIDAPAWGCNQNAFFYMFPYQDRFHRDQKDQKLLRNTDYW